MIRKRRVIRLFLSICLLTVFFCLFVIPEGQEKGWEKPEVDWETKEETGALEEVYLSYLSTGSFREGEEAFRERMESDPGTDRTVFLEEAAEDFSILGALPEVKDTRALSFATPQGAAAAACFFSVRQKLQGIFDQDSELLKRAEGPVALKEVTGGNLWKQKELAKLSEEAAGIHPFTDLRLFQAELFGASYLVTVVLDSETFRYRIFSLKRTDGTKGMRIADAKKMLAEYPEENPEEWFP